MINYPGAPLATWDSGWYFKIATSGYSVRPSPAQNNVCFYPLYPLMTRYLSRLTGLPITVAGTSISILALLGALLLYADIIRTDFGNQSILACIGVLLCYPGAFFLAAFYSEALFLLAVVAAFWGARRQSWLVASIGGGAAALTRINGFVIILALGWIVWEQSGRRWRNLSPRGLCCLTAVAIAAASYPFWLWRRFGDPLLYFHEARRGWGRELTSPWQTATRVIDQGLRYLHEPSTGGKLIFFLNVGSITILFVLIVALFRARRIGEGLFVGGSVLLACSSGTVDSALRYALPLFPAFMLFGEWLRKHPALTYAYVFCGSSVQVLLIVRFVHGLPVA